MGFLTPAARVVAGALAAALRPPPPPDITRWCEENIVFDERSPMPGPFSIERLLVFADFFTRRSSPTQQAATQNGERERLAWPNMASGNIHPLCRAFRSCPHSG